MAFLLFSLVFAFAKRGHTHIADDWGPLSDIENKLCVHGEFRALDIVPRGEQLVSELYVMNVPMAHSTPPP